MHAVRAVFESWNTPRAQVYRRAHGFRTTSARPSTSSRWSSATRATRREPASASPATRDGRAGPLRRVPRQRPGRGRRLRDPDAGAARGDGAPPSRGVRRAARDDGQARAPLPRRAGHRVHGRGGEAVPPPDTLGEADGGCRAEVGGVDGRRGVDQPRGGDRADRPGAARPAAAPDDRSEGDRRAGGKGPERVAGRRVRPDRLRRRQRRGACKGRRGRDPRALGDDPGRHPRDDRGERDRHRARRHDLARGGRRARDGQALRRGVRRRVDRRAREAPRRSAARPWARAT